MATNRFETPKPPFRYFVRYIAQNEDFISDARCILKLSEDDYLRIAGELSRTEEFLGYTAIYSIVESVLGQQEDSEELATFIYQLTTLTYEYDLSPAEVISELGAAILAEKSLLDEEEKRVTVDRLQAFIGEPQGIARQHKAKQLEKLIGAELDDFRFICDIRPIFDQQHERIDGAVPISILKLDYTDARGQAAVLEVRVTEEQIERFENKVADAKSKLSMIKTLLSNSNVSIPVVSAILDGEG